MLLVDPPTSFESCHSECSADETFSDYQRQYEDAVLSLPFATLNRVLRFLSRGFRGTPMTSSALQAMVLRECADDDAEPTGKVARLVVLGAFARSLEDLGVEITTRAQRGLAECERKLPQFLRLAIEDHWGEVRV